MKPEDYFDTGHCISFETSYGRVSVAPTKDINDTSVAIRLENNEGQIRQFCLSYDAILAIHDAANYYAIDKQIRKLEEVKTQGESNESNT